MGFCVQDNATTSGQYLALSKAWHCCWG